ncbi:MAG: hypothetical protein H0U76_23315 [Ktedonobacteraceae bacterium]|nr:hypothetical protein [Ktedonobacteraceae bacterium]
MGPFIVGIAALFGGVLLALGIGLACFSLLMVILFVCITSRRHRHKQQRIESWAVYDREMEAIYDTYGEV